ncbi:MAG TPA: DUF3078 domain-containing protein [Candidatus Krumholzibacteria bacterium]|nr:DUF3078 domain-containing protein [Candidatus Krumholzibacteria bacterium]
MNRIQPGPGALFAVLLFVGAVLSVPPVSAQDDEDEEVLEVGRWYPGLETGLILSQSAFSDNWAGGDQGQFSWTFLLDGSLRNQLTDTWRWDNALTLAYGKTAQENEDGNFGKPRKSTDRIDFESILRATFGFHLDPYASLRVESQFEDASDPLRRGSLLFNPVFVKEALGVAHDYLPGEDRRLLVRFGGAIRQSIRQQYATDDPTDDATQTETGLDGGLEFVVDYEDQYFDESIAWSSKLTLYQPLFYSAKDDLEDLDFGQAGIVAAGIDPDVADFTTTLDVDWENVFTGQVNEYLSVNLYVRLVYDKYDTSVEPLIDEGTLTNTEAVAQAIRKAGQFKQTLALGLTYRFF